MAEFATASGEVVGVAVEVFGVIAGRARAAATVGRSSMKSKVSRYYCTMTTHTVTVHTEITRVETGHASRVLASTDSDQSHLRFLRSTSLVLV